MRNHDCPGLAECTTHPRWHVIKHYGDWVAYLPHAFSSLAEFRTHAAAITYAQKEARREC